jgi:hypothetical protein
VSHVARFVVTLVVTLGLFGSSAAVARAQGDAHAHHGSDAGADCVSCPKPRESSGTAWQPDLAGMMHPYRQAGAWLVGTHLEVALTGIDEAGPRGDAAVVAPNHGMVNLRRPAAGGTFGIRTMWSLDPLMGPEGYPLLGQTGETADGINPLIDRQHPHDFVMELAATWERPLSTGATLSFYLAAVGEPALGPPAFMHRPSGRLLPVAPMTHHWFDSTHITQGVITVGLTAPGRRARFEGSVFRGKEPDEKRWGLETPRFDSFSLRLSLNPTPGLALQASAGVIKDPEFVHPDADVTKLNASAMYARRWNGLSFDATAAVTHTTRTASLTPVEGGFYYSPGATSPALLVEGTLGVGALHQFVVRAETAQKGELFGLTDPRHTTEYPLTRATFGYALRLLALPNASLHVGGAWSTIRVADEIRADYGGHQTGALGFVRMTLH